MVQFHGDQNDSAFRLFDNFAGKSWPFSLTMSRLFFENPTSAEGQESAFIPVNTGLIT